MIVGVDVGGTFTDAVALVDGVLYPWKGLSTPDDFAEAFLLALDALRSGDSDPVEVRHATTAATNAILTRSGARTALLTTKGYRDLIEIGRPRFPRLYDLTWEKPVPLVPRRLRIEVDERIDAQGSVERGIDPSRAVAQLDEAIRSDDVVSVAISLLNAHVNNEHEEELLRILSRVYPDLSYTLGSWVSNEPGEMERTSTAIVNAFVGPVLAGYLGRVQAELSKAGNTAPFSVMRSDGNLTPLDMALRLPANVIESGPAAGVIAAAAIGSSLGDRDLLTVDIGGTTAKGCVVANGMGAVVAEYSVGSEASASSRLLGGSGFPVRTASLDITEMGAGGGSLIALSPGGRIHIGPESAGADPGPACYGQGGTRPTLTDAHVVVGHIGDGRVLGGTIRIDRDLAMRAMHDHVASRLDRSVIDAAHGCIRVANAAMTRLLRSVTVERGRDPQNMSLVAYGGAGPLHAAALASTLRIRRVIVPPHAGLLSAAGLQIARKSANLSQYVKSPLSALDGDVARIFRDLRERLLLDLPEHGMAPEDVSWEFAILMRNRGQGQVIEVPASERQTDLQAIEATYANLYRDLLRIDPGSAPLEVVSLRARAFAPKELSAMPRWNDSGTGVGRSKQRLVYWGDEGLVRSPVVAWGECSEAWLHGPAVVEAADTTVAVPPRTRWQVTSLGIGILEVL